MKKTAGSSGIEIRYVQQTPEQKAATEKMLASPCPYCSDPKKFQRELKGEGREEGEHGVARVGKFWKRPKGPYMLVVKYYDHGNYFRMTFEGKHFIPRFKDFRVDIINFEADYSPWAWVSNSLLFGLIASPGDLARFNKFPFNVARVTHKKSPIVVDAHTWFSHGTILTIHHLPRELSSDDVMVMQEAMEFFRPETRGGVKITEGRLRTVLSELGEGATQKDVAEALGVTEQGLDKWRSRRGYESWQQLAARMRS